MCSGESHGYGLHDKELNVTSKGNIPDSLYKLSYFKSYCSMRRNFVKRL